MESELKEMPVDRTPEVVVQASQEELLASINSQLNPDTANVAPVVSEPTANAIQPVQNSGQENGTNTATTPVAAPITGEQPKVDTPALTDDKLKEFLEKKHVPIQDTYKVVEMYKNLEKEFSKKSQELASLKRIVPEQAYQQPIVQQPVSQITGLPYSSNDPNAQILEDLQQNPIETMKKVAELSYGPQVNQLMEQLREQQLHNTIVKLSTSPETAEFNLPIVQEEIKTILSEKPEMRGNMADNLSTLNDIAIGRLYRQGKLNKDAVDAGKKIAEQNLANRQNVVMENAIKPAIPNKTVDSNNLDDFRNHILDQIAKSGG